MPKRGKQKKYKHHFLVTITYDDSERFGRVFNDREKAERFAARQKKSPLVKSVRTTSMYVN